MSSVGFIETAYIAHIMGPFTIGTLVYSKGVNVTICSQVVIYLVHSLLLT